MPIAGGTDLVPNMKHKLFTPGHLVALKRVDALHGIERRGGELLIGAAESLAAIARHPLIGEHLPALAKASGAIAHPMIRNQATIGGNICLDTRCTYYNQTLFWRKALGYCLKKDGDVCRVTKESTECVAAHCADTPPILMALNAEVNLASADGYRSMLLDDFYTTDGIWNTKREPHELVTRIRVPVPAPRLRMSFQKLRERKSVDFPLVSLALALELSAGPVVESVALVVAALGAKPLRISGLESVLVGERLTNEKIEEVAQLAYRQCDPLENIRVDVEWRRAMVPVYVRRAFREAMSGSAGRFTS